MSWLNVFFCLCKRHGNCKELLRGVWSFQTHAFLIFTEWWRNPNISLIQFPTLQHAPHTNSERVLAHYLCSLSSLVWLNCFQSYGSLSLESFSLQNASFLQPFSCVCMAQHCKCFWSCGYFWYKKFPARVIGSNSLPEDSCCC